MTTKQLPVALPGIQEAIYQVALSLDSLLVNGIPYGVLQGSVFPGFLQERASNLRSDLASLEERARQAPAAAQPRVAELLVLLGQKCQQLVDLVTGLTPFRTSALEQVRANVSWIPVLRGECVQLIQELEAG